MPKTMLLAAINASIEADDTIMLVDQRWSLVSKALRLLSWTFNSDKISASLKQWTMDAELLSVLDKVIEFDKASSTRSSMSCFALFIVVQLIDQDWK